MSVARAAEEEAEAPMVVSFERREREKGFSFGEKLRLAGRAKVFLFSLSLFLCLILRWCCLCWCCCWRVREAHKQFLIVGKWIWGTVPFREVGLTSFQLRIAT